MDENDTFQCSLLILYLLQIAKLSLVLNYSNSNKLKSWRLRRLLFFQMNLAKPFALFLQVKLCSLKMQKGNEYQHFLHLIKSFTIFNSGFVS